MRNPGIDAVRVIGIVAIVAGHVWNTEASRALLYGWHVPVFFFLTGYLWKPKTLGADLRDRWGSLGRPYLFWLGVLAVIFVIVEPMRDGLSKSELAGIALGGAYIGRPFSAFWFVTALLGASILMRLLEKTPLLVKVAVVAAGVGACYVVPELVDSAPWALGVSVAALFFMYAGRIVRRAKLPKNRQAIAGAFSLVSGFAAFLTGLAAPLDMKYADLGTPGVSLAASLLICIGLTWTGVALFQNASPAVSQWITSLATVGFVVVLSHAGVLYLLDTQPNEWLPDFWIALILPWVLGLLLIKSPLKYWAVGGRRPALETAPTS